MRTLLQKQSSFIALIIVYGLLGIFLLTQATIHTLGLLIVVLIVGALFTSVFSVWLSTHQQTTSPTHEIPTTMTLGFDLLLSIFAIRPGFLNFTLATGLGLLFFILGLAMIFIPQNGILGVRVPRTYHSPEIWAKTNYLGGWVFALSGLVILILGNLWPAETITVMLVSVVVAAVISISYAYLLPRPKTR
ncbi:MAG TPA: hypothetical protein DCW31_05115 [Lactobacillus sp.]|nr:hypothetical protein [Lactobacillus sp.]